MRRPPPVLFVILLVVVLGLLAQLIPLYTDWLWFEEVGYTQVFLSILSLRGGVFTSVMIAVLVFLWANLTFAGRAASPDVVWELEDQLGLPGRVVIEPLLRRFLPAILIVIAIASGLRATSHWDTVIGYMNGPAFGTTDPLFERDLSFYVFFLPFWRLLHGWGTALVTGTVILALAVYVLRRSLAITTRGPRLAVRARAHLLVLGALLLALKAIGFWLDRYELLFSPRGAIYGASYADIHASLPMLGALAVLAALCAVACLVQIGRRGIRFVAGGLAALGIVWVVGLGVYPALLQRFRVVPNELAAERPFIAHNIRMTPQPYGLDRIVEREFPADETLDARSLERNAATVKNIRLWDYRPLLRTFAQLQEIRTYYKFVDVRSEEHTSELQSRGHLVCRLLLEKKKRLYAKTF